MAVACMGSVADVIRVRLLPRGGAGGLSAGQEARDPLISALTNGAALLNLLHCEGEVRAHVYTTCCTVLHTSL